MKRLSTALSVAGCVLACASLSLAATTGVSTAPVKPPPVPVCMLETQPDLTCKSGFRDYTVCYVKKQIVSEKMGACLPAKPPARPK